MYVNSSTQVEKARRVLCRILFKNLWVVGKQLVEFFALDSNLPLVNAQQISIRVELSCKHSHTATHTCARAHTHSKTSNNPARLVKDNLFSEDPDQYHHYETYLKYNYKLTPFRSLQCMRVLLHTTCIRNEARIVMAC